MKRQAVILLALLLWPGCKSSDQSQKKADTLTETVAAFSGDEVIPLRYRSIYIHNFDNQSFKADIVGRLKQRLQVEFQSEGRLKVTMVKEEADLWLYGKIDLFQEVPRTFDNFGRPNMFMVTMLVTVKVRINPESPGYLEAREKNKELDAREADGILLDNKPVRLDITYTSRLPPFESQFSAHQRLIDGISLRIRKTVLEGWYSDLKTDIELGYDPKLGVKEDEIERVIRKDIPKEQREEIIQRNEEIKKQMESNEQPEFMTPDQIQKK